MGLAMVRAGAAKWHIDPARVGIIGFSAGAVPADAPPLFGAIAWDDQLFPGKGFAFESAWYDAKRPVELHVYAKGGHGFGLGQPGTTNALLLDEFTIWLKMQHFLDKTGK